MADKATETAPWDDEPKKDTETPPWADDAPKTPVDGSGSGSGEKAPWDDQVDYLAKGGPVRKEDLPTGFGALTELVTRPSNAAQTLITDLVDNPKEPGAAASHALEQFNRPGNKHPPNLFSDEIKRQLGKRGIGGPNADLTSSLVGGAGAVVTDPMNAVAAGGEAAVKGAQGLGEAWQLGKSLSKAQPAADSLKASYVDKAIGLLTSTKPADIAAYRADPELMKRAEKVAAHLQEFDSHHYDMGNMLADKERKLADATGLSDEAVKRFLESHSVDAHRPSTSSMPDEVKAAIQYLDEETKRQDSEAYDMLDAKGVTVPKRTVLQALRQPIRDYARTPKVTPGGIAGTDELIQLYNNIQEKLPQNLTGQQVKDLVKEIQRSATYGQGTAARVPEIDQALQRIGGSVHGILKGDKEYDDHMVQLANDTKLLSRARAVFGNEMTVPGKLDGLHRPAAAPTEQILSELGDRVGLDFRGKIDNYKGAHALEGNPDHQQQLIESSVPEYQAKRQAEIERNMTKAMIDQLAPTGPKQNEAFVRRLVSPRAEDADQLIRDRQALQLFDRTRGTNMEQKLNDTRVATSLNKGRANGSANVNMYRGIGSAIGGGAGAALGGGGAEGMAMGSMGALIGGAGGGAMGRAVDTNGGRIARWVVDMQRGVANGVEGAGGVIAKVLTGPTAVIKYPAIGAEVMRQINEQVVNPTPGPRKIVIQDPAALRDFLGLVVNDPSVNSEARAKMFTQLQKTGALTIELPPEQVAPVPGQPPPVDPMGTLKGILGKSLGG